MNLREKRKKYFEQRGQESQFNVYLETQASFVIIDLILFI
jgi:hypothetical protein